MKKTILGISAYYHDSAACLIIDGEIVAAAQEERFTRKKGDNSFPHNAINYCLNEGKINIENIDYVAYYEDSILKFSRILEIAHYMSPYSLKSFLNSMPSWLTKKLWLEKEIKKELGIKKNIIVFEHHLSHAASAFYPSPYEKAAILTVDGVGEWATATYGIGEKNDIKIIKEMKFPNSIGILYSAFTYYTGFKINSGEYKLMGLAPYGKPIYEDIIKKELITIYEDGSININQKYFNYTKGITTINKNFENLFGGKAREPESEITQKEMDIAASIQNVINEIMLKLVKTVLKETKCENIVLSGGVALNVSSIGYIKEKLKLKNIWIQPASGDAGGALGVALLVWYKELNKNRKINELDSMAGAFLGPDISELEENTIEYITKNNGNFQKLEEEKLVKKIAQLVENGNVVGIARGRMEFGPRALGNRSILADARREDMQKKLNLKIKFRESFRPFAPIVLKEDANKYFEIKEESPYMLSTYKIVDNIRLKKNEKLKGLDLLNEKRSEIPAVTHIDYSARVQTIDKERNDFIYKVLEEFKKNTGCSVMINTSFNVRGEPIVNSAIDAYDCFMRTDMDYLVLGNYLLEKKKQDIDYYRKNNKVKEFEYD